MAVAMMGSDSVRLPMSESPKDFFVDDHAHILIDNVYAVNGGRDKYRVLNQIHVRTKSINSDPYGAILILYL